MSDDPKNDPDNLDIEDFSDENAFDDFNSKGTLGDIWRNNPMVKIGVILGAFAFIVAGVILFGGKAELPAPSEVVGNADLTEAPGTAEVSESYRQAIEEENTRRIEEALRENESAVPMPVEPPKGTLPLQIEDAEEEDPLDRWRKMQEERIQQQQILAQDVMPAEPDAPKVDTRTPAVNALSQAMSVQMEAVLSNQQIKPARTMQITTIAYLEALQEKERQAKEAEYQRLLQQQQLVAQQQALQTQNIIIPAGTIEYGQLLTEANSDVPGPVLVQLASGPLKGARMLGTFQVSEGEDYLTLNFNSIVVDGVSTGTNAVAIDPATTLPGSATEVDNRYLSRIALPAAAAFIEGLAGAISESGRTDITINSTTGTSTTATSGDTDSGQNVASGIEEAGEEFGDLLEDEADKIKPLVRIAAGTPMGILFVEPVIEGTQVANPQTQNTNNQNQQPIFLQPGYFPSGYFPTLPGGIPGTVPGTTTGTGTQTSP